MESSLFFSWFQLMIGASGVLFLFLILVAVVALGLRRRPGSSKNVRIEVKKLNEFYSEQKQKMLNLVLSSKEKKELHKKEKNEKKAAKALKNETKKRLFVLDFYGDVSASALPQFKEQINAVLQSARPDDEVAIRLESPGGMVHAYGLAASQIERIREQHIPLTILVDKVAASGGYMMACLANKIIAAPFAIIGSIGVVASVPNFHKLLTQNKIDYLEITSGEYKRTVSMLGEITEKGLNKFQNQVEETHMLFKDHIQTHRPKVSIETVSTGEYWLGTKALEHKLVDELGTSDAYLLKACQTKDVYHIFSPKKETLREKLVASVSDVLVSLLNKALHSSALTLR